VTPRTSAIPSDVWTGLALAWAAHYRPEKEGTMKQFVRCQGAVAAVRPLSEAQFLRQVIAVAELGGWRCYHPWISLHSPSGWPDVVAVKAGEPLILAELKTAVGRVTPLQQAWLDLLRQAHSVEVYVWRPSDWPEIETRFLRRRPVPSTEPAATPG